MLFFREKQKDAEHLNFSVHSLITSTDSSFTTDFCQHSFSTHTLRTWVWVEWNQCEYHLWSYRSGFHKLAYMCLSEGVHL